MTKDNLNPNHYVGSDGITQVNDMLRIFLSTFKDGYSAHLVGNAIEYLLRFEKKNGLEDAHKALINIELLIEYLISVGVPTNNDKMEAHNG